MALNQSHFTEYLESLIVRRKQIMENDSLTFEEKKSQFSALDNENDELNQSLDIFERIFSLESSVTHEELVILLDTFKNDAISFINSLTPDLLSYLSDQYSSNAGYTVDQTDKLIDFFKIINYDELNGDDGGDGSIDSKVKTLDRVLELTPFGGKSLVLLHSDMTLCSSSNYIIFDKKIHIKNYKTNDYEIVFDIDSENSVIALYDNSFLQINTRYLVRNTYDSERRVVILMWFSDLLVDSSSKSAIYEDNTIFVSFRNSRIIYNSVTEIVGSNVCFFDVGLGSLFVSGLHSVNVSEYVCNVKKDETGSLCDLITNIDV